MDKSQDDLMQIALDDRDLLISFWPDTDNNSPILYHHGDGTYWLETVSGNRWPDRSGPFETREKAVLAAIDAAIKKKAGKVKRESRNLKDSKT